MPIRIKRNSKITIDHKALKWNKSTFQIRVDHKALKLNKTILIKMPFYFIFFEK